MTQKLSDEIKQSSSREYVRQRNKKWLKKNVDDKKFIKLIQIITSKKVTTKK